MVWLCTPVNFEGSRNRDQRLHFFISQSSLYCQSQTVNRIISRRLPSCVLGEARTL